MNYKKSFVSGAIVSIAIYSLKNLIYSYLVPSELIIEVGDIVEVPLGNRVIQGIVLGETTSNINDIKLKSIIKKLSDHVFISFEMIQFIKWVSKYNMSNFSAILKMVIPNIGFMKYGNNIKIYCLNEDKSYINKIKITKQRQEIINLFLDKVKITDEQLKKIKINQNILKYLVDNSIILLINKIEKITSKQNNLGFYPVKLNTNQIKAFNGLNKIISENKFSVSLLDGVPGSGKTEVYFNIIDQVLKDGKAILIMLPEISLSSQWIDRFKIRYKVEPYIWHSDITNKQKQETYYHIIKDKIKVIVGTRSSLFLPIQNLGLIIIDEEHDQSFKQEEKVIYNARDMAIVRAKIFNIPIILATATPSVETWYNTKIKKYNYFKLENRYNESVMPTISIIDMKKQKLEKNKFLSETLIKALAENLNRKQQSLLFINRRGYAPLNFCSSCGKKIICPNCSTSEEHTFVSEVPLIEHRYKNKLICHKCGYSSKIIKDCASCEAKDSIFSYGPGIEKITEEVNNIFNNARVLSISSDIVTSTKKSREIIDKIMNHEVDILVGTQLIAKGYHFPKLSMVGIIDANFINANPDLKSNERTWQLFYQVIGRAGREKHKGHIFMQVYDTESLLLKSLVNYSRDEFLDSELKDRQINDMPPFNKMASIIVSSSNESKVIDFLSYLRKMIPEENREFIKGPIPALLYKLNNRFRYRFLVNIDIKYNLQKVILSWLLNIKIPSYINLKIDVDPISFY